MLVGHGHVTVNGRRVDIPSYLVRPGDVIRVKNRPKSLQLVQASAGRVAPRRARLPQPRSTGRSPKGHVLRLPEAADVSIPVQPHLIVELCSK